MQVSVIKNTESKNVNIPLTAAAGAGAGLAVRQFFPVYQPEIDTVMFNKSDVIKRDNIVAAKKSFVEKTQKMFKKQPENKSMDLFLKWVEAKSKDEVKAVKKQITEAPKNIQEGVTALKKDLSIQIKAAKNLTEANIKSAVRQSRSIPAYMLPGAALAALGAYIYNVIGTISED